MRTMKRMLAGLWALLLALSVLPAARAVPAAPKAGVPAENCHSLSEAWFGPDSAAAQRRTAPVADPAARALLDAYFQTRAYSFTARTLPEETEGVGGLALSSTVRAQTQDCLNGIAALEQNAKISITDAEVTTLYDQEHVLIGADGTVTVFAYEWTFFDYDDLRSPAAERDVSGFGVSHKLVLRPGSGGFTVEADEYDASDILGVCTLRESTRQELEEMGWTPELGNPDELAEPPRQSPSPEEPMGSFYADYNPDACACYADEYVYHGAQGGKIFEDFYNTAYTNYNSVGGDCANYTSQCISAGGMPQVMGTAYGTNGWYYKTGSDRSATWTAARYLRNWMASNRGVLADGADDAVFKGSPVFYNNAHATICVGTNAAGTPIINSHNNDSYHVVWNYWAEGTTYTTVQLTAQAPADGTPAPPEVAASALSCAAGDTLTFSWPAVDGAEGYWVHVIDEEHHCMARQDLGSANVWSFSFPAGRYQAAFTACNSAGMSAACRLDIVSYDSPPQAPALRAVQESFPEGERIDFSWDPAEGAERYEVRVVQDGIAWERLTPETECAFAFTPPAGDYSLQVAACNPAGETLSEPVCFSVLHQFVSTVTAPGCLTDGWTTCSCTVCGETLQDDFIQAPGHAWDEGSVSTAPTDEERGVMTFVCTRCGETKTRLLPRLGLESSLPCDGENCPGACFEDLPAKGHWAHDPIDWAYANGVTSGCSPTAFGTVLGCTRAQLLTFLWRAAGSPAFAGAELPFRDVKEGSYYYHAVCWAVEKGIAAGVSDTEFAPTRYCSRAEAVTFLWRWEGSPAPERTDMPFADVPADAYYRRAVLWAVERGVTAGTGAGIFSPRGMCTRAQCVAFLYAAFGAQGQGSGTRDQGSGNRDQGFARP